MSIWSSLDHKYQDKFDVAYSLYGDKVRLIFWSGDSTLKFELSIDEAKSLSETLFKAGVK